MIKTNLRAIAGLSTILSLSACATTHEADPPLTLNYSGVGCNSNIDLSGALKLSDDEPKKIKRMMRNREIVLTKMLDSRAQCFRNYQGVDSPYAIFEIPRRLSGRVVYAGSKIYDNSLVAANISVLNGSGSVVRTFTADEFRKLGTQYGVQFSPSADAAFVMIKADDRAIGDRKLSKETVVDRVYRHGYYGDVLGNSSGGGHDIVADTKTFARTFAYEGEVGIRVVFPKQDIPQP